MHPKTSDIIEKIIIGIIVFAVLSVAYYVVFVDASLFSATAIPGLPGADSLEVAGEATATSGVEGSYVLKTLIPYLIKFGLRLAAAVAVCSIIIGGYFYVTAMGEDEQYNKAKRTIMYSIIGLIVALLSIVIVEIIGSITIVST